ncbi:TPA: phage tail assembly chaperone [Photobacterium damselae]
MDFYQTDEIRLQSQWESVRYTRAILLKQADEMVNMANDKGEDSIFFRQYRQALRDIPQTYDNPDDVIWPAKPTL